VRDIVSLISARVVGTTFRSELIIPLMLVIAVVTSMSGMMSSLLKVGVWFLVLPPTTLAEMSGNDVAHLIEDLDGYCAN